MIFSTLFSTFLLAFSSVVSFTEQPSMSFTSGVFEAVGCRNTGVFYSNHQKDGEKCDDFILVDDTKDVELKLGVNFGIDYVFIPANYETCYEETRQLEHPPVTQPNGDITTVYQRSYLVGDCEGAEPFGGDAFIWSIEEPWEAVTGKWVFKILVDGEVVAYEEFTTIKPAPI